MSREVELLVLTVTLGGAKEGTGEKEIIN